MPKLLDRYESLVVRGKITSQSFNSEMGVATAGNEGKDVRQELSEEELRDLFEQIDTDRDGFLSFKELRANKRLVERQLPELIGKWEEIDENKDGLVSIDELLGFFGPTGKWLDFKLSQVIACLACLEHAFLEAFLGHQPELIRMPCIPSSDMTRCPGHWPA